MSGWKRLIPHSIFARFALCFVAVGLIPLLLFMLTTTERASTLLQ